MRTHLALLEPRLHVGSAPPTDALAYLDFWRELVSHPPERDGADAEQLRLLLQAQDLEYVFGVLGH
jgi:hypothetical protein